MHARFMEDNTWNYCVVDVALYLVRRYIKNQSTNNVVNKSKHGSKTS